VGKQRRKFALSDYCLELCICDLYAKQCLYTFPVTFSCLPVLVQSLLVQTSWQPETLRCQVRAWNKWRTEGSSQKGRVRSHGHDLNKESVHKVWEEKAKLSQMLTKGTWVRETSKVWGIRQTRDRTLRPPI
jgi:hypothetical protein